MTQITREKEGLSLCVLVNVHVLVYWFLLFDAVIRLMKLVTVVTSQTIVCFEVISA